MFNATQKVMVACGIWEVWLKKAFHKFRQGKEMCGIIGVKWEIWQTCVMEEDEIESL